MHARVVVGVNNSEIRDFALGLVSIAAATCDHVRRFLIHAQKISALLSLG